MEQEMQKSVIYIFILMMCWALAGCSDSPSTSSQGADAADTEPGQYYSFVSGEGDYKVLKVLVVGENLIHVCFYNNVFQEKPAEKDIPSLYFGEITIADMSLAKVDGHTTHGGKHIALTLENWDHWAPEFLSDGEVLTNELVKYAEWKNGDRYVNRIPSLPTN